MRRTLMTIREYESAITSYLYISESSFKCPPGNTVARTISEPYRTALAQSRSLLVILMLWRWATEFVGGARDVRPRIREAIELINSGLLSEAADKLYDAAYELVQDVNFSSQLLSNVALVLELYLELVHWATLMTAESITGYWTEMDERLDLERVLKDAGGDEALSELGETLADHCKSWMGEALGSDYIWGEFNGPIPMVIIVWAAMHGQLKAINESMRSRSASKQEVAVQADTSESVTLLN